MAVLNLGRVVGTDGTNGKDGASCLRNLLDNSDFANPVNQRNATGAVPGWAYCIDRWLNRSSTAGTLTITSDGIQFNFQLCQYLPETLKNGTVVTAAARWSDGTVLVANGTITRGTTWKWFNSGAVDNRVIGVVDSGNGSQCYMRIESDSTKTLQWAALYEGTYTADTLPEYVPKGYGAELAECARYFLRIGEPGKNFECGIAQAALASKANAPIAIPAPMRLATPTVTITSGSVKLRYGATDIDASGVSVNAAYNGVINLAFAASGLTQGRDYVVRLASATLDISADL